MEEAIKVFKNWTFSYTLLGAQMSNWLGPTMEKVSVWFYKYFKISNGNRGLRERKVKDFTKFVDILVAKFNRDKSGVPCDDVPVGVWYSYDGTEQCTGSTMDEGLEYGIQNIHTHINHFAKNKGKFPPCPEGVIRHSPLLSKNSAKKK